MAAVSIVACAQSVTDDVGLDPNVGTGSATDAGPDTNTHHDYGSVDSSSPPSGDDAATGGNTDSSTGGGGSGDSSTGGGKDSSTGGGQDSSTGGGQDSSTGGGGGGLCGNSALYIAEYLAAPASATPCTDGSECSNAECCEIDLCVAK